MRFQYASAACSTVIDHVFDPFGHFKQMNMRECFWANDLYSIGCSVFMCVCSNVGGVAARGGHSLLTTILEGPT